MWYVIIRWYTRVVNDFGVSKTTQKAQHKATYSVYTVSVKQYLHIVLPNNLLYLVKIQTFYIMLYVLCISIVYCIDSFNYLPATAKIKVSFSIAPHSQPFPTLTHSQNLAFLHVHAKWQPCNKQHHPAICINMLKIHLMLQMYVFSFMPCSVVSLGALNLKPLRISLYNVISHPAQASPVKAFKFQSKTLRYSDLQDPQPAILRSISKLSAVAMMLRPLFFGPALTWRDGPHRLLKLMAGHLRHRSSRTGTQTSVLGHENP